MEAALLDLTPTLPDGMLYTPELITAAAEEALVDRFAELPFRAFEFQGFLGKRRVVSFGWRYDFNLMKVEATEDMPDFLLPLRERAAAFAGLAPAALQQVLLTEYGPGAGIGWHKDRSVFGEVVGISLLAPCVFRLRRKTAAKPRPAWERLSFTLAPRSAYLLAGPARTEWEHSIPEVESLRYSVTLRNLRVR
ncbi:MAG: alpha-ketoglutarate-dependent dioxygenase AlkB [Microvirga sp.]|jgi:alkylated DNA repair dioxygenase AlkB|nr:alpha-ketoglutarate-dependent dioxygenase AlkB [Beijerinckiaceae bacterium]HZY20871.1 alpha-ketoglutarate-dependent dioxygenase AlkB [Beijerinckiaceae bacterium]